MKTTPYHYILQQRIGKAKLLLSGGLTPIKEIALLCGFDSLEVFYRQFKKETNLTPGGLPEKIFRISGIVGQALRVAESQGKVG